MSFKPVYSNLIMTNLFCNHLFCYLMDLLFWILESELFYLLCDLGWNLFNVFYFSCFLNRLLIFLIDLFLEFNNFIMINSVINITCFENTQKSIFANFYCLRIFLNIKIIYHFLSCSLFIIDVLFISEFFCWNISDHFVID